MNFSDDLKKKLKDGKLTIGSWLSFGYPPVCEMMAKAGFDWLVIDMEHTAIDIWQAQQLIQIIDLCGCVPLVRVGANDPLLIKRVLDAGAHGVVVPMVNTVQEARKAVAASQYPPIGNRGVGLGRAQGYGLAFREYREWSIRNSILIVQIEHIEGVNNLNEIMSVEGVDGFIVGPYDLSGSLGYPGEFDQPEVSEALLRIEQIVKQRRIVGGYHVVESDPKLLRDKVHRGYKFIAYGDDMVFLAEKLKKEISVVRENLSSEANPA